jgi:hypothetical protein
VHCLVLRCHLSILIRDSGLLTTRKEQIKWVQWLTLVILATWEAEIKRITVQASLGKIFMRPPHLNRKGWVWLCATVGSIKGVL